MMGRNSAHDRRLRHLPRGGEDRPAADRSARRGRGDHASTSTARRWKSWSIRRIISASPARWSTACWRCGSKNRLMLRSVTVSSIVRPEIACARLSIALSASSPDRRARNVTHVRNNPARHAEFLQHRHHDRRAGHEGGVEDIDRGDRACAIVGAGPGLHRGEGRHDEQPAGDREAGEIDRGANAGKARETISARAAQNRGRRHGPRCKTEIERRRRRATRRRPTWCRARCARARSPPRAPEPTPTAIENSAR